MTTLPNPDPGTLRDLHVLRDEYRDKLSQATNPDENYRLYRMVQELNACIERMEQKRGQ